MRVIAVIGDIVGSKEVARRDVFQRKLSAALEATGGEGRALASPYTITLGDEFQAVYREAGPIFADIVDVLAEIHPVRARVAIGVGELSTRLNPKQALGMDGPAFHRAREALTSLKGQKALFRIAGDAAEPWALANHALNLVSHQLRRWERNRLLVLAGLLRGRSVREIEEGMRISRVAVYKNIRAAALDEVTAVCHELTRALNAALHAP
ncbi:MAG TPA: SatD family protein [Opitutaceae bacterium]